MPKISHLESNNNLSVEYVAWCTMKARCYNLKNKKYPLYGARGIKVCERWMNSYENFLADMGRKPSPIHSLERDNANGDYTPDNCRWATPTEQARNRRRTVFVDLDGVKVNLKEEALKRGIKYMTAYHRWQRRCTSHQIFQKQSLPFHKNVG